MSDQLNETINRVKRRAWWTALMYGLGWALTFALGSLLAAGLLDFFLRIDYRPVRILLTLSLLTAIAAAVYRFLLPQLRHRLTDVIVAQQIQQRFPLLRDKVASAVEFLRQEENDVLAGSASLRRAVVVEATADLERCPVREVVNYRTAVRPLIVAAVALLTVLTFAMCAPAGTGIALMRLTNPFGDTVWPRNNQLVFHNPPARLASGKLFEVELIDENGRLPDEVTIEYRFNEQDGTYVVAEPMDFVDGIMVAQRDNVRRPFSFRAIGGDDRTPWHRLEIVEAPRVQTVSVEMRPPAYTGWPTTQTSGRIVGIAGTEVRIVCDVTKPVETATLVTDNGKSIMAAVSADGLQITVPATDAEPWLVKQSGTYSFRLVDREQVEGGETDRWQVRVFSDQPPSVNIEAPRPELHVTAEAVVPIRVFAKDGLAIRDIALKYTRSDQSELGEQSIMLYKGDEQVKPLTVEQQIAALAAGERRIAQDQLDLAPLKLKPGTQITIHASAHDYQPAEGKSEPAQHIYVITKSEMADRLGRRQTAILGELMRAVQREKDARAKAAELEIQLDEVGRLKEKDIHRLQGLELTQREVRKTLVGKNDGILSRLQALLDELESNNIKTPEMARQLDSLAQLLRQIDTKHLAPIERELTASRKDVEADFGRTNEPQAADTPQENAAEEKSEKDDAEIRNQRAQQSLNRAGAHQDQVIRVLEGALNDLQRWDKYRRFARDLAGIERGQRDIKRDTEVTGNSTRGHDPADLKPQQRADLKKIAERQLELARNFDKVVGGMEQAGAALQESDPLAAAAIDDAAHHARQKGLSGQMRSAAQNVQRNQVGQAAGRQQSVAKHLDEMIDILANRREQELSRLVKKLREAEAELEDLSTQHKRLKKKLKDAEKIANQEERQRTLKRLARQQQQLKDKMDRLARRLQRLRAQQAARSLADAADSVGNSGQCGECGDGKGASEQAKKAQQELKDAQRKLAQARRQAEAELANEQLAKMQDQIKALIDREGTLLDETQRLEQLRLRQQRLSRAQRVRVADLSRQQLAVVEDTSTMAESLASAPVFQMALRRAAAKMQDAGERLGQLNTGSATQRAEQQAIAKLKLLILALANDKADAKQGGGGAGGGGGGGNQSGGRIRSLGEIKLLKLLQEDLNQRVADNRKEIAGRIAAGEEVGELINERLELAREQGEQAKITFDLLDPGDQAPEDHLDELPDIDDGQPGEEQPGKDGLLPTIEAEQ